MASGPVTSWQIVGKVEEVTDFLFLGSKITVDGDCRHEIRRRLLLGSKVVTNLDSMLKSKDIILPTESIRSRDGLSISHVQMWELDSKEGRALKNWCFWTVVLEKVLESPLESKEIKPILKEINSEYSLEELILKLKIQYFGHLMWIADLLEKILMLGKFEGRRRRGW